MSCQGKVEQVALGGTFDPIHDGHRALFHRAFRLGHVTVGLTSDELARRTRPGGRSITAYETRLRRLSKELRTFANRYNRSFEIRRLTVPTGIAHAPKFDRLVVSPETEAAGQRINDLRTERGIEPLILETVAHVRAEDGDLISSTRIIDGLIDEHGNVRDST